MATVEDLTDKIKKGITEVFNSDKYKNFLSVMSKFHNYSARNNLLILLQKPNATHVAGYVAWKQKFNRQVQRGAKAITIIGYTPIKRTVDVPVQDPITHKNLHDKDGNLITEKKEIIIPYYTPVNVFDVSDTKGEPLPKLCNELIGNVENYKHLFDCIKNVSPFPINFENIPGGAKGYCSPSEQKIVIQEGLSELQTIKTAIHEITHADLHAPQINLMQEKIDRKTREIEAESVAFIVCTHYDLDTSDYSFPYLASWSSSKELKELESSLDTIQKQASNLIDRIDTQLEKLLINSKEIDNQVKAHTSIKEKINTAKTKSKQHNESIKSKTLGSINIENKKHIGKEVL